MLASSAFSSEILAFWTAVGVATDSSSSISSSISFSIFVNETDKWYRRFKTYHRYPSSPTQSLASSVYQPYSSEIFSGRLHSAVGTFLTFFNSFLRWAFPGYNEPMSRNRKLVIVLTVRICRISVLGHFLR